MKRCRAALSLAIGWGCGALCANAQWTFTDVTTPSGLSFQHGYSSPDPSDELYFSGGVAVGDYDGDGWPDLYVILGDNGPNVLLHNEKNGTFSNATSGSGVALLHRGSGPAYADIDGDGWLDLVVGTAHQSTPYFFRGLGDGTFEDRTADSGLPNYWVTTSPSFGDYDRDGDLDLFLAQWNTTTTELLWRNDGNFHFTGVSATAFAGYHSTVRSTFTPNWTDIDQDQWPDLVIASDFGRSKVLRNQGDGTFANLTDPLVITDEHGMGATVGDYDNDGDLDWFVTSIHHDGKGSSGTGITGNRLYRNDGSGVFEDVTETAGVRAGFWGWGACFADFDNDGDLDLFHTNGWRRAGDVWFDQDPSRLFVNQGDGTFLEEAAARGIVDSGQGRSPACFDYDRDGDLDLLVFYNGEPLRLFRNDGGNTNGSVQVRLAGPPGNTEGVGGHVQVFTAGQAQLREIRAGSNYLSQNPAVAHFGIGAHSAAETVRVTWPDGTITVAAGVAEGSELVVDHGAIFTGGFESGDLAGW